MPSIVIEPSIGKTYTLEGHVPQPGVSSIDAVSERAGVIPRSIHTVFDMLNANMVSSPDQPGLTRYSVSVSHLEIYNEELADLLGTCNPGVVYCWFYTGHSSLISHQPLMRYRMGGGNMRCKQ